MIATQSGPVSLLRRLAYQNNLPVPTLIDDPSGWELFPEFQVNGSPYKNQSAFSCMVSLSSSRLIAPSSYETILVLSVVRARLTRKYSINFLGFM